MLSSEQRIELLKNCRFLAAAPSNILGELAARATAEEMPAGTAVVTAGETGHTMYIIAAGRVRVHDGDITLAELGQGELFGEMTVLDEGVRSATVTALEACRLLTIDRAMLFEALKSHPEGFESIMHAILQRERSIVEDVRTRTERLMGYQKELEIGRKIQADFLPDTLPQVDGWDISGFFEAAREVAGDFYDAFRLPSTGQIALVIGDVCDKGVGAALYMSLFRSLIRATAMYGYFNLPTPDEAGEQDSGETARVLTNTIQTTNRYIAITHPSSSMFASVFFGLLDPVTGVLSYLNAGHEAPVIFRADGTQDILEVTGGVLGLFPGARFGVAEALLQPGDLLFAYTDGVNEAKDSQGEQFGDDRIQASELPPQITATAFLDGMFGRIRQFRGRAPASDDITMLAIRSIQP